MWMLFIALVVFVMCISIVSLLRAKYSTISFETFIAVSLLYVTAIIGFAFIYTVLHMHGYDVMIENGKDMKAYSFFEYVETSMYFSAVTLFSVGYGDLVPVGVGRWIAMLQAFLGYALPAAFVARTVIERDRRG